MTRDELLAGGPGLDGYAYQADVYCADCGRDIIERVAPNGIEDDAASDSNSVPQPIFFGESDTAQHCADCGEHLYGPEEDDEPVGGYYDRFDIVAAWHLWLADNHKGQNSPEYARLSRVYGYFRPGTRHDYDSLSENAQAIYVRLNWLDEHDKLTLGARF